MRKLSKRQKDNSLKVTKKLYSNIQESISLLQKISSKNFNETFELHVNLNIDPKYADQQLRATVILPHGTGKEVKICVLTNEENFDEVKKNTIVGMESNLVVGNDNLIEDMINLTVPYNIIIATPNIMPKLAKLGRKLGAKGLMPTSKNDTVTTNLVKTIKDYQKGKYEYKVDKTGIVHCVFGKVNFTTDQLIENLMVLYNSIEQNRPSGIKGKYFKSIFICTTMGPSLKFDLDLFS